MEAADLVKLLQDERRNLQVAVGLAHKQREHARNVYSAADTQKVDFASKMEGIGETFGNV